MKRKLCLHGKKAVHIKQIAAYFVFYILAFMLLENRDVHYHILDNKLDYIIPFVPVFIIPYIIWFVFVPTTAVYFAMIKDDDKEYERFAKTMFIGNTLFLLISFVFPNGQALRPVIGDSGIFGRMVSILYLIDTPTNVLPSMHVFNATACCIALINSKKLKDRKIICGSFILLTILIILSTVFLKQHTVIDVVAALLANNICTNLFYKNKYDMPVRFKTKKKRKTERQKNII